MISTAVLPPSHSLFWYLNFYFHLCPPDEVVIKTAPEKEPSPETKPEPEPEKPVEEKVIEPEPVAVVEEAPKEVLAEGLSSIS